MVKTELEETQPGSPEELQVQPVPTGPPTGPPVADIAPPAMADVGDGLGRQDSTATEFYAPEAPIPTPKDEHERVPSSPGLSESPSRKDTQEVPEVPADVVADAAADSYSREVSQHVEMLASGQDGGNAGVAGKEPEASHLVPPMGGGEAEVLQSQLGEVEHGSGEDAVPQDTMPPPLYVPERKRPRDIYETQSLPPPVLSDKAIYCRLSRVFKPKMTGEYMVDEKWVKAWQDVKDGRSSLYSMFEKVAYSVDRGLAKTPGYCCVLKYQFNGNSASSHIKF